MDLTPVTNLWGSGVTLQAERYILSIFLVSILSFYLIIYPSLLSILLSIYLVFLSYYLSILAFYLIISLSCLSILLSINLYFLSYYLSILSFYLIIYFPTNYPPADTLLEASRELIFLGVTSPVRVVLPYTKIVKNLPMTYKKLYLKEEPCRLIG